MRPKPVARTGVLGSLISAVVVLGLVSAAGPARASGREAGRRLIGPLRRLPRMWRDPFRLWWGVLAALGRLRAFLSLIVGFRFTMAACISLIKARSGSLTLAII